MPTATMTAEQKKYIKERLDIELGNQRLLQLAAILDKADAAHRKHGEPTYDQGRVMHDCGTPACAAGHWVVANKDRWEIRDGCTYLKGSDLYPMKALASEFSLTPTETEEIFSGRGCDRAETAKEAASFIRKFVKTRSR